MKVQLVNEAVYPPVTIDSTVIKNGRFQLKGKVDRPGMYQLIIDKTGQDDPSQMLASRFYLENSVISYSGHVDSLRTYYWSDETFRKDPVIKGSASQDLYDRYLKSIADLRKQSGTINEKYLEIYHRPAMDGIFNTEEGIALIKQENEINKKLNIAQWKFIEEHPENIVGYDLALQFLQGMYVNLTVPQLEQLTTLITKAWANIPPMAENFKTIADKAKTMAIGEKYQDIELMNPEGKMVKLSSCVPEGKYVMLEFWASWCGPCRGEIPHLRHVYQEYKDKGFEIISISIDEKKTDWDKAMKTVYKTFIEQQRKDDLGPYKFRRKTDRQGDTLLNDGWGSPVKPVGLIVSSFRPSDDATLFGFLIPSNLFAITSLRQLAEMMREIKRDNDFARKCDSLADEVQAAVDKYGVVEHPEYGKVYAFEVDGFHNHVFMDDANVPSLLALPYLGCVDMNDPIYQNTRRLVLSDSNPYFFQGKAGESADRISVSVTSGR